MVNKILSDRQVAEVRALLELGQSVRSVQDKLKQDGVQISIAQIYCIRYGQSRWENLTPSTNRPGRCRTFQKRQIIKLLHMVNTPNPPTQSVMVKEFKVSQSLISRELMRNDQERLKK